MSGHRDAHYQTPPSMALQNKYTLQRVQMLSKPPPYSPYYSFIRLRPIRRQDISSFLQNIMSCLLQLDILGYSLYINNLGLKPEE